jgi:peptide/nickel transport system ATP-binding protein
VTIQSQILSEVQKLTREMGMGLIWISHDLGVVGQLAHKVAVMYAGRIVERGSVDQVLDSPRHPYTRGLLDSLPMQNDRGTPLRQIPGNAPPPLNRPEGCPFRPRCAHATEACLSEPAESGEGGRGWRCFHPLTAAEVMA